LSDRVTIEQRSVVPAPIEDVWQRVTSLEGINAELAPFVRMTLPLSMKVRPISAVRSGDRLGRSWLLLFGLLPFDFDDIGVHEIEHGRRFHEKSRMASMRSWEHERTLRECQDGTEVHDRITLELKYPFSAIPFLRRLVTAAVRYLFVHRHRRLALWAAGRSGDRKP
jgi:ligand-binding SRPBCC domain-containing protein